MMTGYFNWQTIVCFLNPLPGRNFFFCILNISQKATQLTSLEHTSVCISGSTVYLSCERRHCQSISAFSLSRQVLLEQNLCLEMHLWILTESYEGKAKTIFPLEKDGMPCYHFFKNPMHLQGLCLGEN